MPRAMSVLAAGLSVIAVLDGKALAGDIALIQDGKPVGAILIAENPTPAARLAALELQHHIEQITGAMLSIRHPGDTTEGPRILVGESEATRALGLRGADFQPQEYLIRVKDNTIVLMGRDWEDTEANRAEVGCDTHLRSLGSWRKTIDYNSAAGREGAAKEPVELPGVLDDQGTCYATYDFLERFCGARWYGPTPLGVVLPSKRTLTVPTAEIRRSPSLSHRQWPRRRLADYQDPVEPAYRGADASLLPAAAVRRREMGRQPFVLELPCPVPQEGRQ